MWLTVTEYLCHKWQVICCICRCHNSIISKFITCHCVCSDGCYYLEQEFVNVPDHVCSHPIFSGVRFDQFVSLISCINRIVSLLRSTAFDYQFGIFKLFFNLNRGRQREPISSSSLNMLYILSKRLKLTITRIFYIKHVCY